MAEDETVIVLSTVTSPEDARRLARLFVTERLAACVQIVPGLTSVYVWQGALLEEGETLLVIKTMRHLLERLEERLLAVHPYDVPEFVALSPELVSAKYRAWLEGVVLPEGL